MRVAWKAKHFIHGADVGIPLFQWEKIVKICDNQNQEVVMFIGNLVGPSVSPILETGAVDKLHAKSLDNCSYIIRTPPNQKKTANSMKHIR